MKKTFMTLLSTENYLEGVLVLYKSLLNSKTKYPFTVILSERISKKTENILHSKKIQTIRITNEFNFNNYNNINLSGPVHWKYTFEKLNIFSLTDYEKIVFLDSDMLIMENIDELFDKKHMSAVGPAGGKYPGNENYNGLNSGLLVIEPNKNDFENLIRLIPIVTGKLNNCGDQDVIIEYFIKEWRNSTELHLDDKYNMIFPYIDYYINNFGYTLNEKKSKTNIKIIHFIGTKKPWMSETDLISFTKLTLHLLKAKMIKNDKSKYYKQALYLYKKYLLQYG